MNRRLSPGWTLFIFTGLNLFNYLDRYVLSAVLPPLADHFKLNGEQSGRTSTVFMIGYFVTAPIFGYLGDRVSRKWLVAAGIFVWSLGTVLTGFAGSYGALLAYRVLVGVGEASYATIGPGMLSDTFGPARRNNALTIFYVAIPVGAALGYMFGGFMADHYSWRDAFLWSGVPGFALALVLLPFQEPKRGAADSAAGGDAAPAKTGVGEILGFFRNTRYMLVVWGYVAYTFAMGAFAFWGPAFLEQAHGLSTAKAAGFFGAVTVFSGLVGTMAGGFAATAWQKRNPAGYAWVLALSVLPAVPIAFLALWVNDTNLSMAFLALAIFLLFLSTGPVNTLILDACPVNLRSSAMALSIFMIHLFGDMWSPQIVGALKDKWHSLQQAALILPVALLVCGVLWLILAFRDRKTASIQLPR